MELDINRHFDTKVIALKRTNGLAELIKNCESELTKKVRETKGTTRQERGVYGRLLNNFLCAYMAVQYVIHDLRLFKREGKKFPTLERTFSLYEATKGTLNTINDEDIEAIRLNELSRPTSYFSRKEIENGSDHSLLEGILTKLLKFNPGSNARLMKYGYFNFFNNLREISLRYMHDANLDEETLNEVEQVRVIKEGMSFKELPKPEKATIAVVSKKDTGTNEELPDTLPDYEPNKYAQLNKVVGNQEAIEQLQSAIIKTLCYNPETKENPFFPFNDAFMIYGAPGVGKNLTVDALLNFTTEVKEERRVQFVDLSSGILSSYKDKSAQMFDWYISLQSQGEGVYINIIDEADGFLTSSGGGQSHEESKKLLREMKKAINNSTKGNALYFFMTNYAESFEAALKQRFMPVEMEGPNSANEFALVFRNELGSQNGLNERELYKLGTKVQDYKLALSPNNASIPVPITGRTVKKIVSPFVSGDDRIIVGNYETLLRLPTDKLVGVMHKLKKKPSYDSVDRAVDDHIQSLIASGQQSTEGYNGK